MQRRPSMRVPDYRTGAFLRSLINDCFFGTAEGELLRSKSGTEGDSTGANNGVVKRWPEWDREERRRRRNLQKNPMRIPRAREHKGKGGSSERSSVA